MLSCAVRVPAPVVRRLLFALTLTVDLNPCGQVAVGTLALTACAASPQVVAATTTTATVETLNDAIGAFARWREVEEPKLATAAIAACKTHADVEGYHTCTTAFLAEHRAPVEKVKRAITAYRDALILAQGAANGDLVITAAAELIRALDEVGIRFKGAP